MYKREISHNLIQFLRSSLVSFAKFNAMTMTYNMLCMSLSQTHSFAEKYEKNTLHYLIHYCVYSIYDIHFAWIEQHFVVFLLKTFINIYFNFQFLISQNFDKKKDLNEWTQIHARIRIHIQTKHSNIGQNVKNICV